MQPHKCGYTCGEAVLTTMDHPPLLPPKRAERQPYARPRDVSFDERSHKPATLAVESFGRLGIESNTFIYQLAASVVGGRDGGLVAKKGVVKGRLLQIISAAKQVAISHRVSRFKLQPRDHQESRRTRRGGEITDPRRWHGDGASTRLRTFNSKR